MFGIGILRLRNSSFSIEIREKAKGDKARGEDVRVSNEIKRVAVGCPFLI
jgi:hypothetical protein